jgi:hypothetical protein
MYGWIEGVPDLSKMWLKEVRADAGRGRPCKVRVVQQNPLDLVFNSFYLL